MSGSTPSQEGSGHALPNPSSDDSKRNRSDERTSVDSRLPSYPINVYEYADQPPISDYEYGPPNLGGYASSNSISYPIRFFTSRSDFYPYDHDSTDHYG